MLIVVLINLEIVHQLMPFVRLDGYWALADMTGIPDFFSHMGPFLRSLVATVGDEQAAHAVPSSEQSNVEPASLELNVSVALRLRVPANPDAVAALEGESNERVTSEAADVLYGVTMEEPGVSSIVGVQLEETARTAPV